MRQGLMVVVKWVISAPGVMAAGAFSFMLVWIEYMFAITFVTTGTKLTLSAGLATIVGQYMTGYGFLMAAAIFGILPAIAFFFAAQSLVIKGLVSGAIKG
jgi:ABC-type glycerol-3-phosphate transport system permease component